MPHKHKRIKTGNEAHFNLAPTSKAKPIPVKRAPADTTDGQSKKKQVRRKKPANDDDTPKAFARLMQFKQTGKGMKGLDDGPSTSSKKKRKREEAVTADADAQTEQEPALRIQPGERLGDYAARVDQALPVAGLIAKGNQVGEVRLTKHTKKLQKLVNNWKIEDGRRREKEEEQWDLALEGREEDDAMWEEEVGMGAGKRKAKKGGKKGSDDEDPWEELKAKRERPKGVFDVVQAPPQFTKVPKEFKVKNGAKVKAVNVPKDGSSLRRQEMLSEARMDVIKRYREMMQAKRAS